VSKQDVEVPAGPLKRLRARVPVFSFGEAPELRDTSKPVMYDADGNPIYAPRGIVIRWP